MRLKILFLISGWCIMLSSETVFAEDLKLWKQWLSDQVDQHPTMVSELESLNAARSQLDGASQPLYNPELESELEREGDSNNYRLGIKQTFDWRDKRGARTQQFQLSGIRAKWRYQSLRQKQLAETLTSLVEWRIAYQRAKISRTQESHLTQLVDIIQQRHQAGDMSQIETELAYMALSQRLKSTADAEATLKLARAKVVTYLPAWNQDSTYSVIPDSFWQWSNTKSIEQLSREHPDVAGAETLWQVLNAETELTRLEQHADPSLGINVGRQENESSVGLTFSIPLNVRNNFSANTRAVAHRALSAESSFRALFLQQLNLIKASQEVVFEYETRFKRWQNLTKSRPSDSSNLLKKQWRIGDLSTTDYIQILNQRSEGLIAGIELEQEWRLAYIEFIKNAGIISDAITSL
jgi:outer membrane protein TolC